MLATYPVNGASSRRTSWKCGWGEIGAFLCRSALSFREERGSEADRQGYGQTRRDGDLI